MGPSNFSEVKVAVTADVKKLVEQFKKAQQAVDGFAGNVQKSFDKFSDGAGQLRAAVAGILASSAARKIVDLTSSIDDMSDFAKATDISTTQLQKLAYAGSFVGANMEDFQTILTRVAKTASEATQGEKKAVEAFAELNLKATDANGNFKKTDQILLEVIDKLGQTPAAADRLRIAADFAGKEGAKSLNKMASVGLEGMKQLMAEAEALGLVLDDTLIKKAGEADDLITKLSFTIGQKLKIAVAENAEGIVALSTALGNFTANVIEWAGEAGKFLTWFGTELGKYLARVQGYMDMDDRVEATSKNIELIQKQLDSGYVRDPQEKKDLEDRLRIQRELLKAQDELNTPKPKKKEAEPPRKPNAPRPSTSKDTKSKGKTPEDLDMKRWQEVGKLLEGSDFSKNIDDYALLKILDELTIRYKDNAEGLIMVTQAASKVREEIANRNGFAELNDDLLQGISGWGEYSKKMKLAADDIRDLTNLTPEIIKQRQELTEAAKLVENGFLSGQEFLDYYKKLQEDSKSLEDTMKDLGMVFVSAFEDAIVEGKKFSEVLQALEKDIVKIITRTLVTEPLSNWTQQLAKGMSSGSGPGGALGSILGGTSGSGGILGGLGDLVVSLMGASKGAAFNKGNVVPFAGGGMVLSPTLFGMNSGKMGVMGEAGPEAIVPLRRGRDGKLGIASDGGKGQMIVNNNISVSTPTGTLAPQSLQQIQVALANSMNKSVRRNR